MPPMEETVSDNKINELEHPKGVGGYFGEILMSSAVWNDPLCQHFLVKACLISLLKILILVYLNVQSHIGNYDKLHSAVSSYKVTTN